MPSASPAEKPSGSIGSWGIVGEIPASISSPVSPSTTTSAMPPTLLPTTAVLHAMASRLMMPKGS